jgi:putative Mn2+ efflux pump MntP
MDLLSIIIIGIGLAMDCFAVSISKGIVANKSHFWFALRMGILFGLFQGVMPLIGYFAGSTFANQIINIDHWVAFSLLLAIGGKMLVEGWRKKEEPEDTSSHPFTWLSIITLAFATSIDALATGIIFVPYPDYIWKAVAIIAVISFAFSMIGTYIGVHFGKRFTVKVEVIGGLILIGIGTRILLEHLIG